MRLQTSKVTLVNPIRYEDALSILNEAGRTCYQSYQEENDKNENEKFVKRIISSGHESVIEHVSVTAKVVTNRAVTHQIVRHRIASYSQESQRYCNYTLDKFDNNVVFIEPVWFKEASLEQKHEFRELLKNSEEAYFNLIDTGLNPEQARAVLPNACKTTIVMTFNLREWRHFFKERCSKHADPEIRVIASKLLQALYNCYPVVFEDIYKSING